jgi:diketogulonate reductase-like aldo/keto reductase
LLEIPRIRLDLASVGAILLLLELSYMDLYLIYWPVPEMRNEICGVMVRWYDEKARAIGVSKYDSPDLKELL